MQVYVIHMYIYDIHIDTYMYILYIIYYILYLYEIMRAWDVCVCEKVYMHTRAMCALRGVLTGI
jgi:hypothetical protein